MRSCVTIIRQCSGWAQEPAILRVSRSPNFWPEVERSGATIASILAAIGRACWRRPPDNDPSGVAASLVQIPTLAPRYIPSYRSRPNHLA